MVTCYKSTITRYMVSSENWYWRLLHWSKWVTVTFATCPVSHGVQQNGRNTERSESFVIRLIGIVVVVALRVFAGFEVRHHIGIARRVIWSDVFSHVIPTVSLR